MDEIALYGAARKVFEMMASRGSLHATHTVDLEEWNNFAQIARIVELTNVSNFTESFSISV